MVATDDRQQMELAQVDEGPFAPLGLCRFDDAQKSLGRAVAVAAVVTEAIQSHEVRPNDPFHPGCVRGAGRHAGYFWKRPTMHLIGIPLRKPSHNEVAAATAMAVGLWLAGVGLMRVAHITFDRADAGALLLVCLWGCLSARLGIRIDRGGRHLMASLAVSALLLGVYQAVSHFLA